MTESVVHIPVLEVEDCGWPKLHTEKLGQSVGAVPTGVIGIECDHERVRQSREGVGDAPVGVASAEDGDGSIADRCCGERVDGTFGDEHLGVLDLRRTEAGEPRVRGEIGGGVEVARSVRSRMRDPDLGVDDLSPGDHRQDGTSHAAHSVGARLASGTEVGAHVVGPQDFGRKPSLLG